MRKAALLTALVCTCMMVTGLASAQNFTLSQTVAPLSSGGYFIPGTTQMDVTLTMSYNGADGAMTALGIETTLPAGWSFVGGSIGGTVPPPQLPPADGATGTIAFAWFVIPDLSTPKTLTFKVNVPGDPASPVVMSSIARYRTGGPELLSNTASNTIQLEPTTISVARALSGPGYDDPFYVPGNQITVTITFTRTGTDTITALGFRDIAPAGWTLASVGGPNAPQLAPANGSSGTLEFAWFAIPPFPATFTYTLNIPPSTTGQQCFDGQALFRTGGPELTSDHNIACLNLRPCLSFTRTSQGPGGCYVAGSTLTIRVDFESTCTESITALGMQETIPAGWTFVSVGGSNPPQLAPSSGASGTLEFAWFVIPSFPASFTYTLNVPASEEDDPEIISGLALFRLSGPEIQTPILTTEICGRDTVPPTITILGDNPATVQCGSTYTDAGATANDDRDGDITANITVTNNVNTSVVGSYTVEYSVSDAAGNTTTAVRNVNVVDTTAPTITLNGSATITVECRGTFTDPGATATDTCDPAPTVNVSGTVNTNAVGTYTLTYSATDANGNTSGTVTRTVIVADTTPPTITLNGGNPLTVQCGTTFSDPGATANDTCAGALTVNASGTVNTSAPGSYTRTYTATDPSGNTATVTRTVNVVDTTAPTVTLNGPATLTIQCGNTFTDPGATGTDTCDSTVSINVSGTVNTNTPGTYVITYTGFDDAGNASTPVTRTVTVQDTLPPTITLNGANPLTVQCGASFTDPGATASDQCDSSVPVSASGSVNTSSPGSYTITYTATDDSGNTATATRTVEVVDTTAPVVTLNGSTTVTVECRGSFSDPGATANDSCDGALSVTTTGSVNTNVPGVYTLTYSASDTAGNTGTATRTVNVVDSTPPSITLNGSSSVTVECGTTYTDAGATAADTCDSSVTLNVDNPVNVNVPGIYTVAFEALDDAGNMYSASRTVTVRDTTPPVITLNGASTITIECRSTFSDPGATAADSCDSSVAVTSSGSVNTNVPGVYTITYNATDDSGNAATPVTRSVIVQDTTAPTITLNGSASVTVECGTTYSDAGATATDACDSSVSVVTNNAVNTNTPGTYFVTYTSTDDSGNTATASRTVLVVDTQNPNITLNGNAVIEVDCNSTFTDPGASATDSCAGTVTVTASGSVNTAVPGLYTITYNATDPSGNVGVAARTVVVRNNCETPINYCDLTSVTILSPTTDIIVPSGTASTNVGLSSTVAFNVVGDCLKGAVEVQYLINGSPVGSSQNEASNFAVAVPLGIGSYTLEARATHIPTGQTVSATVNFAIVSCDDNDGDGYPDNVEGCLNAAGLRWNAESVQPDCNRVVSIVRVSGDGTTPTNIAVANPDDPNQVFNLTVPAGAIPAGQDALIVVTLSCNPDNVLDANPQDLDQLDQQLAAGTLFWDITILLINPDKQGDVGALTELDQPLLPLQVSLNGLALVPDLAVNLVQHPTLATTTTGIDLAPDPAGTWSTDGIQNVRAFGNAVVAEITHLSLFTLVQVPPFGPRIETEPSARYDFIFGIVTANQSITRTIKVKNIGTGTVTGTASIANDADGVFSIVGDASYNLASGQQKVLTLQFKPKAAKDYTAELQLQGSETGLVKVTLKGSGTTLPKRRFIISCAAGQDGTSIIGDTIALLLAGAALMVVKYRTGRRSQQS